MAVVLATAAIFLVIFPKLEQEQDTPAATARTTEAERSAESLAC